MLLATEREKQMIFMWLSGLDGEAIAAALNTSRGSIIRSLHSMGVPHRLPGARDRNLWPHIVRWARHGHSSEDIADGIGLTGKARSIALGRLN